VSPEWFPQIKTKAKIKISIGTEKIFREASTDSAIRLHLVLHY